MTLANLAASANTAPPPRLGQRYTVQGFLPDPGNTVVCHLDHQASAAEAVLAARSAMLALPGAEALLPTPVESLHMTLFEGALGTRRDADAWPDWLDPKAPIEATTEALYHRLTGFKGLGRFTVKIDAISPFGLQLSGATPADEAAMRAWRDALTLPFGYRHQNHDRYRFHMTMAYPLNWLPDALLPEWERGLASILADLQRAAPILPLRPPAFCSFEDMTWFEELLPLAP